MKKIAIVAPGRNITPEIAERVRMLAVGRDLDLFFHPQCFLDHGHFAGPDEVRAAAFVEVANDPAYEAIWFARGGYGANRILTSVERLNAPAQDKTYLGYSDGGFLLAALYKKGIGNQVHAPMVADVTRTGGEAAITRVFDWMADKTQGLEPSYIENQPVIAMNATILATLQGTPYLPDLSGHVLLLEEVGEYEYRFDRVLFQIMEGLRGQKLAGLRLGRVSDIPVNTIEFGQSTEEIAQHWCATYGIPYLGHADIGHDSDNKIVPFGLLSD